MRTTLSNIPSLLFLFALIFLTSSCDSGSEFTAQDEAAIRETIDKAVKGFNETGDEKAYTELYYADNATMFSPNAEPIKSRESIQQFAASFPGMTNDYSIKEIYGHGDMAYVVGTYHLVFEDLTIPGDNGKYIEIWRKQKDGSWKITHDIFNTSLPLAEEHDQEADRRAIQKLHDEWASAVNAGDAKLAVSFFSEDCVEMHRPTGKIRTGKDAIYDRFASAFQEYDNDFSMVMDKLVVDRNLAYMLQTVKATWTPKAEGEVLQEHSRLVSILQRQADDSWKVVRFIIWDLELKFTPKI